MKKIIVSLLLLSLLVMGCGETTGSRTGSGAAIGAGAGAVGGYLFDQHKKGNID